MLKVLLCLCFCLAVVLAQEEEPPKEPESQLHVRNRRQMDGMMAPMNKMMEMGQGMVRQGAEAMEGAMKTMVDIPANFANMASGAAQSGRRRRAMQQQHPQPPMPPHEHMPQGQQLHY